VTVSTLTQNPRLAALLPRVAELSAEQPPEGGRGEALTVGLVDALLAADEPALKGMLEALRGARKRALDSEDAGSERMLGWLDATVALVHWSLERITAEDGAVAHGTQAHQFLAALKRSPNITSSQLRESLATDETQVSRTGRRLLDAGLVLRRKVGRQAFWSLSPRGEHVVDAAPDSPAPTPDSFWEEALRRGFKGAGGDEPGMAREVDPTRERIIESTVPLHSAQGVVATSFEQIAAAAGLPLDTVLGYFPTRDDLIKGCGAHVLEGLQMPPPDLAPEVFEGAVAMEQRIRRLVETLFGVYERGAGGDMDRVREDRDQLPLLDQSMRIVDSSIEALIREALGPEAADQLAVDSLRALIGVSVWQAMKERGASREESVESAVAAVDDWLAARPAGP
jgi:AcrR family transcriptional regulator